METTASETTYTTKSNANRRLRSLAEYRGAKVNKDDEGNLTASLHYPFHKVYLSATVKEVKDGFIIVLSGDMDSQTLNLIVNKRISK